ASATATSTSSAPARAGAVVAGEVATSTTMTLTRGRGHPRLAAFVPGFIIRPVATMATQATEPMRAVGVFADVCGYELLTETRGDNAAADVATRFARLARASLAGGAQLLKTLGDGVLIVAPDATAARTTAARLCELVHREPELPP